ncbi:MAG: hypothetical protein ACREXP_25480 [Steroidobacteraceae bacterium]
MSERIVNILNENGSETRYTRYSARLPLFLKEYSPKEGFRVVIERTDLLSQKKGLLSLLREAVVAGRKVSDLGLSSIERDINTIVCVAKLLGPTGEVLRDASAAMEVIERKDFEALETAADQRLLARCGFGGEIFDDEEDADIRGQGGTVEAAPSGSPATSGASGSQSEPKPSSLPSTSPAGPLSSSLPPDPPDDEADVTQAERRQIENLARRVGQPMPELRSRAEVKAARAQLSALDRQRRGAPPQESAARS